MPVTQDTRVSEDKMRGSEKDLSEAVTKKARDLGVLPMDCSYECHVEYDPQTGQARLVCGVRCS